MTGIRPLLVCSLLFSAAFAGDDSSTSGANCTFSPNPDAFLEAQARIRSEISGRSKFRNSAGAHLQPAGSVPRNNFIDDEIFNTMDRAGVASAPIAGDEEFFRRITLDLTGRIPAPADVRAFVASTDSDKRQKLIEQLLASPEFVDKWAVWMGDWLRNSVSNSLSNSPQQLAGRNAYYKYIWLALAGEKSIRDLATESMWALGNTYDEAAGATNFISQTLTPGGPIQDSYDAALVKSATVFLGIGHYDCLLCHNGRGHLEALSLWGSQTTRMDAWKMSAFFARTNIYRWQPPAGTTNAEAQQMFLNNSFYVEDLPTRTYDLNTNYGNRPNRVATAGITKLTPQYRATGDKPPTEGWRGDLATFIVNDPMFSRNVVNRVWKQMFNMALADPVDQLDPARLDPDNPPQAPWTFQATHPLLLEKLSKKFTGDWYNLREMIRFIANSNAYQLSSRYDGDWNLANVPLFARHYPRRLDGEEVHDAIAKATGVFAQYTQFNWGGTVKWAMQLLDPVEPRSNGTSANFMNYFLRGNRDTTQRNQTITVQQQLALMNDGFVTPKLKVGASPVLASIAKMTDNKAIVDEMFLNFISRLPDDYERGRALFYLNKATTAATKNTAIEDLAWVLVNKVDFLFSY